MFREALRTNATRTISHSRRLAMPKRPSPTPEQIETAAKFRAQGLAWETIAKELGCHANTLRRWIRKTGDGWDAALRQAEIDFLREVNAEALTTLRKQIRGKDDRAARDACAKVLTAVTARLRGNKDDADAGPANITATELEEFLMEVPHAVLQVAFVRGRAVPRPPEPGDGLPPPA
jgi:transposase-like protein